MLAQQETFQFTDYSGLYDKVVPKKHLLRQINDLVDFFLLFTKNLFQNTARIMAEKPKAQSDFLSIYF